MGLAWASKSEKRPQRYIQMFNMFLTLNLKQLQAISYCFLLSYILYYCPFGSCLNWAVICCSALIPGFSLSVIWSNLIWFDLFEWDYLVVAHRQSLWESPNNVRCLIYTTKGKKKGTCCSACVALVDTGVNISITSVSMTQKTLCSCVSHIYSATC